MRGELEFDEYQKLAMKTAIYPESGSGSMLALAYVGLGLGEAGEVQGKLKKVIRDNGGIVTPQIVNQLLDEAGDVLWYLSQFAAELGAPLSEIAQRNLDKLADRAERGVLGGSGDVR